MHRKQIMQVIQWGCNNAHRDCDLLVHVGYQQSCSLPASCSNSTLPTKPQPHLQHCTPCGWHLMDSG